MPLNKGIENGQQWVWIGADPQNPHDGGHFHLPPGTIYQMIEVAVYGVK